MEIKIVFNNESMNSKFSNGWGFSCLVDNRILFDTGEKAEYLFSNMKNMAIDIYCIEAVVISHDHWDHTGGLWELLKKRKGLKVYSCPGFSREFKAKVKELHGILVETEEFTEITENIFTTGQIEGKYGGKYIVEQALVVKINRGIIVITGCSHPGIVNILGKVKEKFPGEKIRLAFGGFHLMDKDRREIKLIVERFKEMGVEKVGPTHCTGYEAEELFRNKYKEDFVTVSIGQVISL